MSIRIMSQVWENGPDNHAEKLVLLALADFANDEGECWPSMKSIAAKVGVTERGAQKIIRRLEAAGFVQILPGNGRGRRNRYKIICENIQPEREARERVSEQKRPQNPEHCSGERRSGERRLGEHEAEKPRTREHKTPNRCSPEPSIEPSLEPSDIILPRKRGARLPHDWQLPDDWKDWAVTEGKLTPDGADHEADKFRDYWHAKSGKDAVKVDWFATWRNWCRIAAERGGGSSAPYRRRIDLKAIMDRIN